MTTANRFRPDSQVATCIAACAYDPKTWSIMAATADRPVGGPPVGGGGIGIV